MLFTYFTWPRRDRRDRNRSTTTKVSGKGRFFQQKRQHNSSFFWIFSWEISTGNWNSKALDEIEGVCSGMWSGPVRVSGEPHKSWVIKPNSSNSPTERHPERYSSWSPAAIAQERGVKGTYWMLSHCRAHTKMQQTQLAQELHETCTDLLS